MRMLLLYVSIFFFHYSSYCQEEQELENNLESQMETFNVMTEREIEDDSYVQDLDRFRKTPLNINQATEDDLKELHALSGLQINSFLNYRKLFGKLIDIYELQAIPAWDIVTIKRLLPLITLSDKKIITRSFKKGWMSGDQFLLMRYGETLEKSAGFKKPDSSASRYPGSRAKLLIRYKYNNNIFQWGITGEKDAGEQLFKGSQKSGFDFYSFHLFFRKLGIIKALAIGDFTVNLGQGLIQWHTLAFTMNSAVLNVKRQSPVLKPYTGVGEFAFFRGIGITIQKRNWEASAFISRKKVDAHLEMQGLNADPVISSFMLSGLHRTVSELEHKNNTTEESAGLVIKYTRLKWQLSANFVGFHYSYEINEQLAAYQLFGLRGHSFLNSSIDYSYTFKNLHLYGEAAMDKDFHPALLSGLLIALDNRLDAVLLYRNIDLRYHCLYGNAFTQSSVPNNEKGMYAGFSFRPVTSLVIDAFTDLYRFPWLRYNIDAPSSGRSFLLQLNYKPNKRVEFSSRVRADYKPVNQKSVFDPIPYVAVLTRRNIRAEYNLLLNKNFTVANRWEFVIIKTASLSKQEGFLMFTELYFKPSFKRFSGNTRMLFFNTESFDTRLYAFETGIPYRYELPLIYGKGVRYYLNVNYKFSKPTPQPATKFRFHASAGWSQTIYSNQQNIGSGSDAIQGHSKSQLSVQIIMSKG